MALEREKIMAAIYEKLKTIKKSAGYNNDVGRVSRRELDFTQVGPTEYPALLLFDTGGEETEPHSDAAPDVQRLARIAVVAVVNDGNPDTLSTTFNTFLADVDKLFSSFDKIDGTNCYSIDLVSYLPIETQPPFVIFQANIEFRYYFLKTAP